MDFEKLLSLYPEKRENFVVEDSAEWYHACVPHDAGCDTSDLNISCDEGYIILNYISLPDCDKDKGYGTTIITELMNQCRQLNKNLWVSMAYAPTRSIVHKLIESNNYDYTEVAEPVEGEPSYWDIYVYFNKETV